MIATDQTQPTVCVNHPAVETALRCSRCEAPICGRCAVNTEIGTRCPACSGRPTSIIYEVSAALMVRALLFGLPVAILIGIGMGQWLIWSFWWALLLGIGIGEAVARGANERRGGALQMIAALCVLLALGVAFWWNMRTISGLSLAEAGDILRMPLFRYQLGLTVENAFFAALALFLATRRVR